MSVWLWGTNAHVHTHLDENVWLTSLQRYYSPTDHTIHHLYLSAANLVAFLLQLSSYDLPSLWQNSIFFLCFPSGSASVHVAVVATWVCMCVCFVSCIWIAVDGVILEDSAVHASTLRAQIMFRHSAMFPWKFTLYHHWSSDDSRHRGFVTLVIVSINHIYSASWDRMWSCPSYVCLCSYANVSLCLYINEGWILTVDYICSSHQAANSDRVNLICQAETRQLLTGVEPGQDAVSGILQQQGMWVEPVSSLSASVSVVK